MIKFNKFIPIALFFSVFFISACGAIEDEYIPPKPPTELKVNGETLTWENEGRQDVAYDIKILDLQQRVLAEFNSRRGNSLALPSEIYSTDGFIAQFVTFALNQQNLSERLTGTETEMNPYEFRRLKQVSDLKINSEGLLTWEKINGANAYNLRINGRSIVEKNERYSLTEIGRNEIEIMPISLDNSGNINYSYYSNWSSVSTINVLDTPKNIDYIISKNTISWNGVIGAEKYRIFVNGAQHAEVDKNQTEVQYNPNNKSFEVKVVALGDGITSVNSPLNDLSAKFTFLESLKELKIEDGMVKWEPVSGADAYMVRVNGLVIEEALKSTTYSKLTENKSSDIEIMPVNTSQKTFSNWSALKNITILSAPELNWDPNVRLSGQAANAIFWDGIPNATGYSAKITYNNSQTPTIVSLSASQRTLEESFTQVGEYIVEIKSTANLSGQLFDSRYSKPIIVRRLGSVQKPTTEFIKSNQEKLEEGFVVNFLKDQFAYEYQLYKNDSLVVGANTQNNQFNVINLVDKNSFLATTINFKIQSIGQIKNTEKGIEVSLDSIIENSLSFDIRVLQTPSNITISGETLSWNAVNNSNGYSVNTGTYRTTNTNQMKLDYIEAGVYDAFILSKGNGSDVLPSNTSQIIKIERLKAPTDIKINTEFTNEGTLTWSNVPFSDSYDAYIDGRAEPVSVNRQTNMYQFIKTTNTQIYLVAVANYFKADSNNGYYYMSSRPSETLTVLRLNSPTLPNTAFENGLIKWNAPSNLGQSSSITYTLYNSTKNIIATGLKGNSYDLSNLESGKEYTFYIKAIGDGVKIINSDFSSPKTVFKIGKPEVTLNDGAYEWNQVVGAQGYVVYIDDVKATREIKNISSLYRFEPYFSQLKTYTIKVTALGDGGVTSIDSDPLVFQQTTAKLPQPNFTVTFSSQFYTPESTININITNPNEFAKEYAYFTSGTILKEKSSRVQIIPTSEGKIKISVGMLGGTFDANNTYYIDSTVVDYNRDLIILQKPNSSQIEMTTDGRISWPAVPDRVRYEYVITYDDIPFSEITTLISESFVQINLSQVKTTVKIKLRAVGNNDNIFGSEWIIKSFDKP
jgi:hypothetical protein